MIITPIFRILIKLKLFHHSAVVCTTWVENVNSITIKCRVGWFVVIWTSSDRQIC